jgi:hypothetical protein
MKLSHISSLPSRGESQAGLYPVGRRSGSNPDRGQGDHYRQVGLLDSNFLPAKPNIFRCRSRIKAHARKQVAKARLTSQPIEPGVHL